MRAPLSPALIAVIAAWGVLGIATSLRPRPPQKRETRRGQGWTWGLVLQGLSIAVLWMAPRAEPPGFVLSAIAILLAAASVAVMLACQRVLGAQFAYQARLVEGHCLITAGPYGCVRHPIYTALFGLALANGLAFSRWWDIPFFAVLYVWGTAIRVRREEGLLRAQFGPEFEEYARRVPASVPFLRRNRETFSRDRSL